ncbi:MAG: sulfur oxidation c-type cytochrome SoxX [Hyphomicrobiaceae bacterium]
MRSIRSKHYIGIALALELIFGVARADVNLPVVVTGDAVNAPLTQQVGRAAQGRVIVLSRQIGNCLICHAVPNEAKELAQGNVGPALSGVGGRLSEGQIRLRLIDQSRLNPRTIMPPYYRTNGLTNVAAQFVGKSVLDAQQIEDVVAYLVSLKE